LKIRNEESAFSEGTLERLNNLPKDILGYKRKSGADEFAVLLNFGMKDKEFEMEEGNCIFRLSEKDAIKNNKVLLTGFGAMILIISK
jgi:hypothetical protein